jgi:uncharacterized protein with ParB-like and HNH nuclease domain
MSINFLKAEVEENRKKISTDGFKISLGEINSMYKDEEIIINPDFQRYFRWNDLQKSRLVESILLGIPVPPIFVSQRDDGKWEVIDGLQRLSTILQFMGTLKATDGNRYEPLVLRKTKLIPSLENAVWEKISGRDELFELPQDLKLFIKRASITVEVIKKESDSASKYELFQRLNTLGSSLSDQEVRNCLLIMLNRNVFNWLEDLSKIQEFKDTLSLTERSLNERYESELALRLFAVLNQSFTDDWNKKDVSDVITDVAIAISQDNAFDLSQSRENFEKTFKFIFDKTEDRAFRRYNPTKQRFEGAFLVSAYECIAVGIYENIDDILAIPKYPLIDKIKSLWSMPEFTNQLAHGVRAAQRTSALVPLGKKHFAP